MSDRHPYPVTYEGETEKAYKVTPEGKTQAIWLPKSQTTIDDDVSYGAECRIWVPDWLARKSGLA